MTNNQSNELREILEEHHSIVTNDLGRRLIVALEAYIQDRERLARIDENYYHLSNLSHGEARSYSVQKIRERQALLKGDKS